MPTPEELVQLHRLSLWRSLPRGLVWLRREGVTDGLLEGIGAEYAASEQRGLDLLDEVDPRETVELLAEWERAYGLPDPCLGGIEQTAEERRQALLTRIVEKGGQSVAFLLALARRFGFVVTITEYHDRADQGRFMAGPSSGDPWANGSRSRAGDRLMSSTAWLHTFSVEAPLETVREFRAGEGQAGDPLRWWGNEILECVIDRAKPAHTRALYLYLWDMLPEDWQDWLRVAAWSTIAAEIEGETPPLEAHTPAYELWSLNGSNPATYWTPSPEDFPAAGVFQQAELFVQKPPTDPAADFQLELWYGGTPTQLAASAVTFAWSGDSLTVSGGAGDGWVEDMGGGWWRAVLEWTTTATEATEARLLFLTFPTTPVVGRALHVAGGKFSAAHPYK